MTRMRWLAGALTLVVLAVSAALLGSCHGGSDPDTVLTAATGLRGDLDDDGNPSISDAIGILRVVVGLDAQNPIADADGDGNSGIGDAIAVLRCVVGLAEWPLGEFEFPATRWMGEVSCVDTAANVVGPICFTVSKCNGRGEISAVQWTDCRGERCSITSASSLAQIEDNRFTIVTGFYDDGTITGEFNGTYLEGTITAPGMSAQYTANPVPWGNYELTGTLTATPLSGTAPLPVSFTGSISGPPGAIWRWDLNYGDVYGGYGTSQTISTSHTYYSGGDYTVTLDVMDMDGVSSTLATTQVHIEADSGPGPPVF